MLAPAFPHARPSGPFFPCVGALMVFLGLAAGGCTSRGAAVDPSHRSSAVNEAETTAAPIANIETVHRRKCGNCHTRVEPGSLPRATIEAAMVRHRRRAKLTAGQWVELIEFLSPARTTEPRHTASLP
jgi:hypothetical protein